MKIYITFLTLQLPSVLEATYHVGDYDQIMRRKQNNLPFRFKAVRTSVTVINFFYFLIVYLFVLFILFIFLTIHLSIYLFILFI